MKIAIRVRTSDKSRSQREGLSKTLQVFHATADWQNMLVVSTENSSDAGTPEDVLVKILAK